MLYTFSLIGIAFVTVILTLLIMLHVFKVEDIFFLSVVPIVFAIAASLSFDKLFYKMNIPAAVNHHIQQDIERRCEESANRVRKSCRELLGR